MARYRYGFRLIWRLATSYVVRLKNFPEPGEYSEENQHHGVMPAMSGEFNLSGRQAETILEKCSEAKGVTWDQLRAISACLSYLHGLVTGEDGSNWEEVCKCWESLQYV